LAQLRVLQAARRCIRRARNRGGGRVSIAGSRSLVEIRGVLPAAAIEVSRVSRASHPARRSAAAHSPLRCGVSREVPSGRLGHVGFGTRPCWPRSMIRSAPASRVPNITGLFSRRRAQGCRGVAPAATAGVSDPFRPGAPAELRNSRRETWIVRGHRKRRLTGEGQWH